MLGRRNRKSGQAAAGQPKPDYSAFFQAEFPSLARHVMTLGASLEEAKDAAQSALTDALEQWEQIESPRAWCRKVATRHYLRSDIRTKEAVRRAVKGGWVTDENSATIQDSPSHEREYVLRHLGALTFEQRRVMAYVIDGYTPQEIADITGKKSATVRSNLRYAKAHLAEALLKEQMEQSGAEVSNGGEW